MDDKSIKNNIFKQYNDLFWTVNTLELFERGSYYGIMAYFSHHLFNNLNFPATTVGFLSAILLFLLYFVPIIAAGLAKKVGYKSTLIFAFVLLIPAYFLMTFAKTPLWFFPLIVAWGIGAGTFKPMVSATIAHVTEKEHRNKAYAIYYWTINLGAFIVPLLIGILIPMESANLVFLIGSALISVNLFITIFRYRDPIEKNPKENIGNIFVNLVKVLSDKKFAVLLGIYSGFFMIFSTMHTYLPLYMVNFKLMPDWFTPPFLATINPLTIIVLGPILAKYSDRFESLKLMITGMFIFCFGLIFLGFYPIGATLLLGVFIFSIGEFLTHPNFISYVSKVAPKDKIALYMGFAFLPSAVGLVLGSLIGGFLFKIFAEDMGLPQMFWAIFIGIGFLTISNFLIYNKFFGPKSERSVGKTFWNSKWTIIACWLTVPLLIIVGSNLSGITFYHFNDGESKDMNIIDLEEMVSSTHSIMDTSFLNQDDDLKITISSNETKIIKGLSVHLNWKDEPDRRYLGRQYENQPDSFSVSISNFNTTKETIGSNTREGEGNIDINMEILDEDILENNGNYYVNVTFSMTDAGNYEPRIGPGIIQLTDNGNDFEYIIEVDFLVHTEDV